MDSITHVLSAVIWSEPIREPLLEPDAVYSRWRERAAILLGALAPDVDGVLGWIQPELFAQYHRVVTHSILGLVVIALICAWLSHAWPEKLLLPFMRTKQVPNTKPVKPSYARLLGFAFLAVGMHFLGDWITDWGVWPFWPWSMRDCKLSRVNSLESALLVVTVTAWAIQHWLIQKEKTRSAWLVAVVWLIVAATYAAIRIPLFGPPFI